LGLAAVFEKTKVRAVAWEFERARNTFKFLLPEN
jgi:hypothetical protein